MLVEGNNRFPGPTTIYCPTQKVIIKFLINKAEFAHSIVSF